MFLAQVCYWQVSGTIFLKKCPAQAALVMYLQFLSRE